MAQNVKVTTEGNELVIRIDMTAKGQLSESKKSEVIASTRGNMAVANDLMLGVNCYRRV